MFHDILAQVLTYQIGIPDRLGQQALHAIRGGLSGMLGQVPAIFALAGTRACLEGTPGHDDAVLAGQSGRQSGHATG